MRVIAGQYRSRPLKSLPGMDTRPTSDRLRETLFNVLTAGNPEALQGSRWLDLFAGTGAVGIEALSRGAAQVYFVDSSRAAAQAIRANVTSLGIGGESAVVLHDEVRTALRQLEAEAARCDFCFLDPPYRLEPAYAATFDALARTEVLMPDAMVIAEHDKRFDPGEANGGLRRFRTLKQGDAALSFYRISR
jgi:16S rRNA (guanine(966)-N(2))-methyltransferase RsmD